MDLPTIMMASVMIGIVAMLGYGVYLFGIDDSKHPSKDN